MTDGNAVYDGSHAVPQGADGDERAQLLERIDELTREKLLGFQAEIATMQPALGTLGAQVEAAEEALERAKLGSERARIEQMIAKRESLLHMIEEDWPILDQRIKEIAALTARIEPDAQRLRGNGGPFGVEAPLFDRTPINWMLQGKIQAAWDAGIESRKEYYQAMTAPPVRDNTPQASVPISATGRKVLDDRHEYDDELEIPDGTMCQRGGERTCPHPAVVRLFYRKDDGTESVWWGCEAHLRDWHARFGPKRMARR